MEKVERRLKCELRATAGGRSMVGVIPYNSEADLGGYREVLRPGCFADSIRDGHKIIAFWSHDTAKPLGNSMAGSLQLEDRQDGLHVRITPDPAISWGKDALLAAQRGDLGGFSFGFSVPLGGDFWSGDLRTIKKASLYEISPVVWPAYESSTIDVRNQQSNNRTNNMNNSNDVITLSKREYQAFHAWMNESINDPPNQELRSGIQVMDAPIYRGKCALGMQMADIVALAQPGTVSPEARSRHEQMIKREKALAEKRAAGSGGMVEAVGQDGGLLLQGETTMEMITSGFNNSSILSRSSRRNIGQNQFAELIGVDETSRADGSRGGGVRVYTDKELALIAQSKTKFDKIRLEPKRLTGMYYASNEILNNAPVLQSEMEALFNEEFAFKARIWRSMVVVQVRPLA